MKPFSSIRILWKPFFASLAIFIAIVACSGSNSAIPTTSPNEVATVVAATMEAIQAASHADRQRDTTDSYSFADHFAPASDLDPACRDPHQFPR